MDSTNMRTQWDEMARRNAFYSISSAAKYQDVSQVDVELFWQEGRQQVDLFLRAAGLAQPTQGTMVEIGCGLGRMTHRFSEIFRHVYAIDVSPEMVQRARALWPGLDNVDFVVGNGIDLQPITSSSIEFVFSFLVLQHVAQPDVVYGYIRECSRVLVPNGLAFLQFRTTAAPSVRYRLMRVLSHWACMILRGLGRLRRSLRRNEGPQSLEQHFAHSYKAWRGCSVEPQMVEHLTAEVGLTIESVTGLGSQYTFYRLRKKPKV